METQLNIFIFMHYFIWYSYVYFYTLLNATLWTQGCVWFLGIKHERAQFTNYFWIGTGMKYHCCPLVQAWPACTPWCWWCRPGYGVYVTREKVRSRRKERRRPASIWSCEFSFLQSFTGGCSVLIFILIQPVLFFFVTCSLSALTTSSSWWSQCCSAFLSWSSSTIR